MNRLRLAAIGVTASLLVAPGCGSGTQAPTKATESADAGPNTRLKFKEEYKKMLGKDGQLKWKPSESGKRPEGVPKT